MLFCFLVAYVNLVRGLLFFSVLRFKSLCLSVVTVLSSWCVHSKVKTFGCKSLLQCFLIGRFSSNLGIKNGHVTLRPTWVSGVSVAKYLSRQKNISAKVIEENTSTEHVFPPVICTLSNTIFEIMKEKRQLFFITYFKN